MQTEATPLNLKITRCGAVAIKAIQESKTNPRQNFDGIDELAASIKRDGVLSPVLVRKRGSGEAFELIFGARRLRAAKVVGLEEIPANVIECSDEEAQEIQIVENCQRADVHPMEEAVAIERLRATIKGADPVGQVAARIGKSRSHVLKRIQLLSLPELGRKAYLAGTIPLETAILIARLPDKETRIAAAKLVLEGEYGEGPLNPKEARNQIERELLLRLGGTTFDRKDAKLVPDAGACGPCPKRSGNNQDLFGDVKGDDLCTDPKCFRRKLDADWAIKSAAAAKNGTEVLNEEACKKLFRYGSIDRGSGYVGIHDETWVGNDRKTYKQILGKQAPKPILGRNPEDGKLVELYRVSQVTALMKTADTKAAKALKKEKASSKASQERMARKDQVDKAAIAKAFPQILEKIEGVGEKPFLQLMAKLMLEDTYGENDFILKRRGVRSAKALLEGAQAPKLRSILLELAIGDPEDYWTSEAKIPKVAQALGINYARIRAEASVELKPKKGKSSA